MNNKKIQKFTLAIIVFSSMFLVSKFTQAQTWTQTQDKIKENTQHIENIDEKLSDLKENYRLLYDGAKNQNDQLGNQISFAGNMLALISLIFTLLGISFTHYVNCQFKKIREMKDIVEDTKKAIDGHTTELYKKLKREETVGLLIRLQEVPEDIQNIRQLLFSRELINTDFSYLKLAYIKLKNNPSRIFNDLDSYIALFMQHFPYEALKDPSLKEDISNAVNRASMHNMFLRDIKNFFNETLRYLKESGLSDEINKKIIKDLFFSCYATPEFEKNSELQIYVRELVIKYGMNTPATNSLIKESDPSTKLFTDWVDLFFDK